MHAAITQLDDGPEELEKYLPINVQLLKPLRNADGSDYALAALENAIIWNSKKIYLIIIGGRFEGSKVGRGMKNFPVNIALVIDNSIVNDDVLDFQKGEYVAIGFCDEIESSKNA